jgi:hypothetical protein
VVAIDFGRCLRTKLEVRPGQVAKWPASISVIMPLGHSSVTFIEEYVTL